MIKYRTTSSGLLIAPMRGKPPPVPDGYYRDEGNPYVFIPELIQCSARSERVVRIGCCDCMRLFCGEKQITRKDCQTCKQ